jgi:hypothetical protein
MTGAGTSYDKSPNAVNAGQKVVLAALAAERVFQDDV